MKLKQLEGLLGGLTQFPAPKVHSATAAASRLSPFLSRLLPDFGKGEKQGGISLLPLGGVVGAGGAGAVPDRPSHRVADALHG